MRVGSVCASHRGERHISSSRADLATIRSASAAALATPRLVLVTLGTFLLRARMGRSDLLLESNNWDCDEWR